MKKAKVYGNGKENVETTVMIFKKPFAENVSKAAGGGGAIRS